jgi:hypothetical protein
MPDTVPRYRWQARAYPWARRALAAAEAVHGAPSPTCRCGQEIGRTAYGQPEDQCYSCYARTEIPA